MIAGLTILRFMEKIWPLVLAGLILAAGYGLIKDAQKAHYERGRIEAEAERTIDRLEFEKGLANAATAELQRQSDAARAALKARDVELTQLRRKYDQLRTQAAAVPDDGCLDRRLPDDADRLLRNDGASGPAGDQDSSPRESGAPGSPRLDRGNLPRPARLHVAAAGNSRGVRGGQTRSQEGDRWGDGWIKTQSFST